MSKFESMAVMAVLGTATGCGSTATTLATALAGETIRLQVGQAASVESGSLMVTFEAVVGDSRCPKGENCFWEGDAVVRLSAKGAAGTSQKLQLHTSSKGPAGAVYDVWSIRLVELEPYPVTGRSIAAASYVVTLEVIRGDSSDIATQ